MLKKCLVNGVITALLMLPVMHANAAPGGNPGGQGNAGKGLGNNPGRGLGAPGKGVRNPHVNIPLIQGKNVPPGQAGKVTPHGLAKQGKVPYGWSRGNAWWKNQPLTVIEVRKFTVQQRSDAITYLRGLDHLTASQIESLNILENALLVAP